MAKKQELTKTEETLPATAGQSSALPAHLAGLMQEDAGKGVSGAQEDNLVPLVYILQAQSPQVNKRSPEYIEGAEAGDIWLRGASNPIVKGEDGFLFQPCWFSKDWVEWVPRDAGGGFVGRHRDLPAAARRIEDPKQPAKVRYVLPNGNEVVETRYHIGFALLPDGRVSPYVIPMTSSGHTVSRQWMHIMNSKLMPGVGAAASFASLYRLRTKERTNAAGTWFTWDVTDAGWVSSTEEYLRGRALNESFASGEKEVAEPEVSAMTAAHDADAM